MWEQIRDAELKLMQNGQEGLVEEGIRATRQGGLINFEDVSPEEPPPVSHGRKVGESYPLDTGSFPYSFSSFLELLAKFLFLMGVVIVLLARFV